METNVAISTVPTGGTALLGIRPPADTVMAKFEFCVDSG